MKNMIKNEEESPTHYMITRIANERFNQMPSSRINCVYNNSSSIVECCFPVDRHKEDGRGLSGTDIGFEKHMSLPDDCGATKRDASPQP